MSVIVLAALAGACAVEGERSADSQPNGEIDEVRIALGTLGNESLDPMLSPGENAPYLWLMFDPLVGVSRDGTEPDPSAGVLSDWEISDDALTITLRVGGEATFHDGAPVTAEDVAFSLERLFDDEALAANVGLVQDVIGDPNNIKVIDEETVELHLVKPGVSLLNILPYGSADMLVVPKHYIEEVGVEEFRRNPIGSGPYKFVEQQVGTSITLERVDEHQALGTPRARKVTISLVPEETTRIALLQTGDVDVIDPGIESAVNLEAEGYNLHQKGLPDWGGIKFPMTPLDVPPLNDVRVREALALAINKEAINEFLFFELGELSGNYISEGAAGYEPLPPIPYDPERAKALLEEAGYPDGFEIALESFPKSGWSTTDIADAIAADWAAIGVTAQISNRDYGAYRADWVGGNLEPVTATLHPISGRYNFQGLLGALVSGGSLPAIGDPEYTELMEAVQSSESVEEFNERLAAVDAFIRNGFHMIPMVQMGTTLVTNDVVQDWAFGRSAHELNIRYFLYEVE